MNYAVAFAGRNGMWLLTNLLSIEKRDTKIWAKLIEKGLEKNRFYYPTLYNVSIEEKNNFINIKGNWVSAEIPWTFDLSESNKARYVIEDNDLVMVDEGIIGKKENKYLKKQIHLLQETFKAPVAFEATVPYNQVLRLEQGNHKLLIHFLRILTIF